MLLDLPDIRQQDDFDCGAAAVQTAFSFLGYNHPRKFFLSMLGTNQLNGTDPRTIESLIRKEGLKVISGEMSAADLRHMANLGRPVITLVTLDKTGHYVTTRGVERGRVYVQDPLGGRLSYKQEKFVELWHDYDRFGVVYNQFGIAVWF